MNSIGLGNRNVAVKKSANIGEDVIYYHKLLLEIATDSAGSVSIMARSFETGLDLHIAYMGHGTGCTVCRSGQLSKRYYITGTKIHIQIS